MLDEIRDYHDTTSPAPTGTPAPAYLGPATVVRAGGRTVVVGLANAPGAEVRAQLAFTFPYEPQVGDSLLVMGQDDGFYAVGVLGGSGKASLEFHGDVDVRAFGGTLRLASDETVEIEAPRITLRAGVLRTLAQSISEKADQMHRWVRGLLAVRAGKSRRTIDGEDSTRCQDSVTLAKDTVKIDGDQLHLGH
jgi:hypothetical protein